MPRPLGLVPPLATIGHPAEKARENKMHGYLKLAFGRGVGFSFLRGGMVLITFWSQRMHM